MGDAMVSVVVATYNREQLLIDALGDMFDWDYPAYEILVVDQSDGHEEATASQLERWQREGAIRWIRQPVASLTAARNRGIREARGEIVLFVDDDVRVPARDFLSQHVRALGEAGVGGVAGRVLEPDRPPKTVARAIGWMGLLGSREPGFGSGWGGEAWSVRGCNMSFHKSALLAIGGFDERFTHSAFREDTDVSLRMRHAGYRLRFAPGAWLYHLGAPSGGTRDKSIAVAEDLMMNDARLAFFDLTAGHRLLWLLRLYGSRVLKAAWVSGKFYRRHRVFFQAVRAARRQHRESNSAKGR
ncbi:MAG: glycosyltransferase [Thermaerobacter sp.]|nr:glycosyltransferase [Thermaerobacter sp.]